MICEEIRVENPALMHGLRERRELMLIGDMQIPGYGILDHAMVYIRTLLNGTKNVGILSFAQNEDDAKAEAALRDVLSLASFKLKQVTSSRTLREVDALIVGDGNIFQLIEWLDTVYLGGQITMRVAAGMPYIGIGAGAVAAGWLIPSPPNEATRLRSTHALHLLGSIITVNGGESNYDAGTPRRFPVMTLQEGSIVYVRRDAAAVYRQSILMNFPTGRRTEMIPSPFTCLGENM